MNTTTETSGAVTLVNKSTAECTAYNTKNAGMIEMGLMPAWKPSDEVVRREKIEAERAAAGFKLAQTKNEILDRLGAKVTGDGRGKVGDVGVEIDDLRRSSHWSYSSSVVGWRLYIGDRYGSHKGGWVGIGDGAALGINTKQLEKAKAKISEEQRRLDGEKIARSAKQTAQQRTEEFIKANPEFCKLVGRSSFDDGVTVYWGSGANRQASYHTAFIYTPEGNVRIGGETFSVQQWTEIYNLRNAQAEAMKALKASFQISKQA